MPERYAEDRPRATVQGEFVHLIYSPKGDTEGVLVDVQAGPVQLVIDHDDHETGSILKHLLPGQLLSARVHAHKPTKKGSGAHPTYVLQTLLKVDGKKPPAPPADQPSGYHGRVVRLNYARHGQANGVVLDSGDFIHLKPEGFAELNLQVGDEVHADGDAQRLADDRGWAVEAVEVNGHAVKTGKPR